jgi:nicotinic acetylcholine receptor
MAMTSVSVIMTVFVLNLHHRGPNGNPVPNWLHNVFLSRLKANKQDTGGTPSFNKNTMYVEEYFQSRNNTRISRNHLTIENLAQELKTELDNQYASDSSSLNDKLDSDTTQFDSTPGNSSTLEQPIAATTQHILGALYVILQRYEREDAEEHRLYEWRQLACVVDKILFWIFLTGTLSSTIIVLIVAPITRWL